MCGIAGILNIDQSDPPREGSLRQMLAMIRHRGPDQFGIYLDDLKYIDDQQRSFARALLA